MSISWHGCKGGCSAKRDGEFVTCPSCDRVLIVEDQDEDLLFGVCRACSEGEDLDDDCYSDRLEYGFGMLSDE